jgi:drug/metabolite transporter superfamily protein YnfA
VEPQFLLTATDRVCTWTRLEVPYKRGRSRQSERVLAAYGGVFIAGLLAWGMIAWDVARAIVSLIGVGLIMYAPR